MSLLNNVVIQTRDFVTMDIFTTSHITNKNHVAMWKYYNLNESRERRFYKAKDGSKITRFSFYRNL